MAYKLPLLFFPEKHHFQLWYSNLIFSCYEYCNEWALRFFILTFQEHSTSQMRHLHDSDLKCLVFNSLDLPFILRMDLPSKRSLCVTLFLTAFFAEHLLSFSNVCQVMNFFLFVYHHFVNNNSLILALIH